ncbi:hypothetical protein AB0H73_09955 [Streptomyces olivoreticuli]
MRVTTLEYGRVRYTLRAPHIRGTFVVVPEAFTDGPVLPRTVTVQYGDGIGPVGHHYRDHRPDEPVVYNVHLHGWTPEINPEAPPAGYFLGPYAVSLRNGVRRELTSAVRRRTETLLRALAAHWSRLPHRHELVTAASCRNAAARADHESEQAAHYEAEAQQVADQRRAVRRRLNVITGIIRRRPRPVREADPAPVKVPITDDRGRPMGVLTVREIAVNEDIPGTVVYEVHGVRVHGRFTVGRDFYHAPPMPEGIHVFYGHARTWPFPREHEHEPTVNGVHVSGGWDRSTAADITATTPADLPATVRTGLTTGHSAPAATERRASAVLRALALRYLARPDAEALRLAAAKDRAPRQRAETRRELRELRERQAHAEDRTAYHRDREQQYLALAA